MKKKINNHKTIFTDYFHSPTLSNATNKISYLPTLNFNFDEQIQNRLKADSSQITKGIFAVKYKLKKETRYNQNQHKSSNLPQLSVQTTLESNRDSPPKRNSINIATKAPSSKNFNQNLRISIRRQTPSLYQYSKQSNHKKVVNHKKSFTRQRTNDRQKSLSGTNQIIRGNKTILNIRATHMCSQQKKKKKFNNNIKFGTFNNPVTYDICPWGLHDMFDQLQ